MLAVVGNGVTTGNDVDRVRRLDDGLGEGLTSLRVYCRKRQWKSCLPENKALLSAPIDEDMTEYSQLLFAAAVSAAKPEPPTIKNMPPVVRPT